MTSLLTRLESGAGSDRATDGAIWCAAAGRKFDRWDGAGVIYFDEKAPAWDRGRKHLAADRIPEYTGSLDAALSLVERMLPGWDWYVRLATSAAPPPFSPRLHRRDGDDGSVSWKWCALPMVRDQNVPALYREP